MQDKNASTSDRRGHGWFRVLLWSILIACCMLWTAYVALRLRTTYELQTEFAKLTAVNTEHTATQQRQLEDVRIRLDDLEQVLFGQVLAKIDKKQKVAPMKIEPWLANALKDLRDRVTILERARIEKENGVDR